MDILITGGGGFIGSHLVDYILSTTDFQVRVLDDFSTGDSSNLSHIDSDRLEVIDGDIRDAKTVRKAGQNAEAIYHLAAAVGVRKIVNNPLDSLRINLQGTENVLELAAEEEIPTFIASSSEVYGKSENVPFAEDDDRVLGPTTIPRWGYASSKAVDEFLALAYHDQHDLPVVVGRYFNVVGPRQTGEYGMVVPRFVDQALAGEPLTVYGDGTQKRCFTHVSDAVRVTYELLNRRDTHGDVYNIGSSTPTTINDLAAAVLEHTDSNSTISYIPFEEAYGEDFEEPETREPDVSKVEEVLGWRPKTNLDQIITDVVAEKQREGVTDE